MRQYRGKTKDGKWVYGYLIEFKDMSIIFENSVIITRRSSMPYSYIASDFWVEVIPSTVGQSTGLHDKNGREIYGGDKFYLPGKEYKVEWNGITAGWTLHPTKYNDAQLLNINYARETEIIGDIHTNPEGSGKG